MIDLMSTLAALARYSALMDSQFLAEVRDEHPAIIDAITAADRERHVSVMHAYNVRGVDRFSARIRERSLTPMTAEDPPMQLDRLDHVNIRTASLAELNRFYTEVMGLKIGPRPPFDFDGSWIYIGETACVHLVEYPETPAGTDPRVEHFAFMATGLVDFMAHLRAHGVAYSTVAVAGDETTPNGGNIQVNVHDPDGNHIEVQFDRAEAVGADLTAFGGRADAEGTAAAACR